MNDLDDLQFYQFPILQNFDMHLKTDFRKNYFNEFSESRRNERQENERRKNAASFLDFVPATGDKP